MALINKSFCQGARSVSHRRVAAGLVSPTGLIRRLCPDRGSPVVLLDSAGGHPGLCHYSFLAWDPRLRLTMKNGRALLAAEGLTQEIETPDPFMLLRELLDALAPSGQDGSPGNGCGHPARAAGLPLAGGAFGLAGYDAGRYIERLPSLAADDLRLPDLDFIFARKLICFDHAAGAAHLFFEDAAPAELDEAVAALEHQQETVLTGCDFDLERHEFSFSSMTRSNISRDGFERMVRRAKEYILAGDIFQSNLSQRLELDFGGEPLDLYDALRLVNPSPFAGYLEMGGYQIISSSPERLVQLQGRQVQTRPIAGTRRRGLDGSEDDSLTKELNLDPKERAEHIMLVDLERNDMGRVCDYGSVMVDELMVNESYSHVIHIVSNVRGLLHRRKDALDLLRAMFPGGTITGCPKVRCMEIIDELEPVRRGPYTGSFGYIGYNGNMDMNIVIRTLVRVQGRVYAQAGAGIVADSDPGREYQETLRKAEAMARAADLAGKAALNSGKHEIRS
ncbi:MAG: anthranilate synthase component I family protein [Thermoleophilia bacterium]|nr:anthranilate synthase component I family protein [Thermoleophilia bacterium]